MDIIKSFGLALAEIQLFHANDLKPFGVDAGYDFSGVTGDKSIGLDDGKCSFHGSTFSLLNVVFGWDASRVGHGSGYDKFAGELYHEPGPTATIPVQVLKMHGGCDPI
jgi:hypothetical protein